MQTTKKTIETLAKQLLGHHKTTIRNILHDVEAGAYPQDVTTYQKGKRYAENGGYLMSGYDARALLAELYGQSDEEASKYTPEQAWKQYCHLVGRAIELLEKAGAWYGTL